MPYPRAPPHPWKATITRERRPVRALQAERADYVQEEFDSMGTSSETTRLTSLAELGAWYGIAEADCEGGEKTPAMTATPATPEEERFDPDAMLAELLAAAQRDEAQRTADLARYGRYESLVSESHEADAVYRHASEARARAESILGNAWTAELRARAAGAVAHFRCDESAKAERAEACRAAVEAAGGDLDLERLCAEKDKREHADREKAAMAERARRLSSALAAARAALVTGSIQEARTLAGAVASENPDNAEVTSLLESIERRWRAVKVEEAAEALRAARRVLRKQPDEAVALLTALDLADLPEYLGRQIFGAWAQGCERLCRTQGIVEPLRYAPNPGQGAILICEGQGTGYSVFSALGMGPGWQPGSVIDERRARRARPLQVR